MKSIYFLTFIFFIISFLLSTSECISTYSIDLSSEFIKIAIVVPGIPMEIALNRESQRKTPSVVFIRGNERLFGEPALNMGVKYPKNLYQSITILIGKTLDDSIVKDFIANFPYYELFMDENNQLAFKNGDEVYTVEELLAMILGHSKNIAETYSEMPMKGGVIVVPPFLTQEERRAVLRSAALANINVLQIINSNTAVGLNYGIFRRKSFNSTAQYYMFYDVGSSATVASIIGYQVTKDKEEGMLSESPQLTVIGVGYDRQLGANQFALRLQKHLAKAFNDAKKTKTDVTTVPRSMAKLLKEASRVVKVLSANSDIYAQIENVLDDKDFKLKISRAEFENMCQDLFERYMEPVHKALESAQIAMPLMKEIILMGGGTRVPKIQDLLLKTTDRQELGKGINTDEAAALGAVYQAAYISPGFKVQKFTIKDSNLYPISIDFLRYKTADNDKETAHPTSRVLFDSMNHFPQKKAFTFNKLNKNFDFNVSCGTVDIDKRVLFHVSVDNMSDIFNIEMKESERHTTQFKGVKTHFLIDDSGLLSLNYIEALFERNWTNGNDKEEAGTLESIGNTISNFFGGDKKENVDKENIEEKEKIVDNNKTDVNDTKNEKKINETKIKPKIEIINRNVNFAIIWKSLFVVNEDNVKERSRKKIVKLDDIDKENGALEKAKNALESYLFDLKSKLDQGNSDNEIYVKCSTESERRAVIEEVERVSEWYDEQGVETRKEEYTSKYNVLAKLMKDVEFRVKELKGRPEAVKRLTDTINSSRVFLDKLDNFTNKVQDNIFTKTEYDVLSKLINDSMAWLHVTQNTFEVTKLYENPTVLVADFEPHIHDLEREVRYLLNKIAIWKSQTPPPPTQKDSSKEQQSDSEKEKKDNNKTSSDNVDETVEIKTPEEPITAQETAEKGNEEQTTKIDLEPPTVSSSSKEEAEKHIDL